MQLGMVGLGRMGAKLARRAMRDGHECVVHDRSEHLDSGDVVIDGGNTYRDDVRHADTLARKGVTPLDCGTSGGVLGLERGYCLVIAGDENAAVEVEPTERTPGRSGPFATEERGYLHCGALTDASHFVKMITTASSTA